MARPLVSEQVAVTTAMASIRGRVHKLTARSNAGLPLDMVVARLNPVLRGWGQYFRVGNSSQKFAAIDSYVHMRLAMLASDKHGQRGRNWTTGYTRSWAASLGVHRLTGTIDYRPAHARR